MLASSRPSSFVVDAVSRARNIAFTIVCVVLTACTVPLSYYDAITYTQLTSLKAESMSLVESFDSKKVHDNEARIEATTLNLRKAYEYEKGKGDPNSATVKQYELITKLFLEDVASYRSDGPGAFGPKFFSQASVVLGQAFDIVIATENAKNKVK